MKDIFEENWTYRILVIFSLCILLVYVYLTNEDTLLNYISGKFILDTRLIWQIGIFALLSLVLFYLLESTLDYKSQNEVLKEYLRKIQKELESEREALKDLKSASGDKIIKLGSFIVTISDMAKQLNSVLETTPLLKTILAKTAELLGSTKCAIFNLSKDKKNLHLVDAIGYENDKLSNLNLSCDEKSGLLGVCAQEGRFYSRAALSDDYNKRDILKNDKLETQFCQPITYADEILAVISIADAREGISDEYIIGILSTMANLGAVALTNTKLVEKIKDQSIRDSLTGLYNHQYFQESLTKALSNAVTNQKPLGFIIIDLDHFKKLNDTYGHQVGDLGLKKLAHLLKSKARADDITARYGGEEFVFAAPGLNLGETARLAEEIRKEFEDITLEFEDVKTKCTLSAGVSAYSPDETKAVRRNVLIRIADKALYEAKEKGRNRVVIAEGSTSPL
jgi:diguanylate cyclase (GGDEF)-like protein